MTLLSLKIAFFESMYIVIKCFKKINLRSIKSGKHPSKPRNPNLFDMYDIVQSEKYEIQAYYL